MPPISHFLWGRRMRGASRGVCVICRQASLDDLRAHQCVSTLHKESSHLRGSLLMKIKRDAGCASVSLIKSLQNVSLRRHYPHQVVGRNTQFPLSRLHRQLPILISNSLSTSIQLPYYNINIFFNIFMATALLLGHLSSFYLRS